MSEIIAYLRRPDIIAIAKNAFHRVHFMVCSLVDKDFPPTQPTPSHVNIRIILAGELILRHPSQVFDSQSALSSELIASTRNFRSVAERVFFMLGSGVLIRDIEREVLVEFRDRLHGYLQAFQTWKVPDAEHLCRKIIIALRALHTTIVGLSPAEQASRVGIEIRTQISRLREALERVGGAEALNQYDQEREMLYGAQIIDLVGLDQPAPSITAGRNFQLSRTLDFFSGRSMPNERLVHEMLIDPYFQLEEHSGLSASMAQAVRVLRGAFWKSIEEDLVRPDPTFVRLNQVFDSIKACIFEFANELTRIEANQHFNTARINSLLRDWSNLGTVLEAIHFTMCALASSTESRKRVHSAFQSLRAEVIDSADHVACGTLMRKGAELAMNTIIEFRLEEANKRLRGLARIIANQGVEYARTKFFANGTISIDKTRAWLLQFNEHVHRRLNPDQLKKICLDSFVDLVCRPAEPDLPETLAYDDARIENARAAFKAITVAAAITHSAPEHLRQRIVHYFHRADKPSMEELGAEVPGLTEHMFNPLHRGALAQNTALCRVLQHYLTHNDMSYSPTNPVYKPDKALVLYYPKIQDHARILARVFDVNFKVHWQLYATIMAERLPTDLGDITSRLQLTTISSTVRVVLPVDPVLNIPDFAIANGTLTIEVYQYDPPQEVYRKVSTGLLYATPDSSEQRTLLSLLTRAIRQGATVPPVPDDLGI